MNQTDTAPASPLIDAHHHLWQHGRYDYGWIQKGVGPLGDDYLPDDLARTVTPCGVTGTVLVQTIPSVDETRWFCELADASDLILGVVGWVDLESPRVGDVLDELMSTSEKFVGVRLMAQGQPDPDLLLSDRFTAGLQALSERQLTCDLLILPPHLPHVPTLAARHPELRFVIDHLAKPPIKSGKMCGWDQDLRRAAEHPNVFCKLSGMITEANHERWTTDDLKPYVHHAIDCLGPQRLMFGSDWPVCLLAGQYDRLLNALRDALPVLDLIEYQAIDFKTARTVYRLRT